MRDVHYDATINGIKSFVVTTEDDVPEYNVGDTLMLFEVEPPEHDPNGLVDHSGRSADCTVTFVLRGADTGIKEGYVVMAITVTATHEE